MEFNMRSSTCIPERIRSEFQNTVTYYILENPCYHSVQNLPSSCDPSRNDAPHPERKHALFVFEIKVQRRTVGLR